MKIAIGCDNAAYGMKEIIKKYLKDNNVECEDLGIDTAEETTAYGYIAEKVALAVANKKADRGILICGTGIGMSIVANKVPGIRAALCSDTYSAERARKSNNAQVITMGARVIGPELAKAIVRTYLESEFTPGPSSPKIEVICDIDEKYRKVAG